MPWSGPRWRIASAAARTSGRLGRSRDSRAQESTDPAHAGTRYRCDRSRRPARGPWGVRHRSTGNVRCGTPHSMSIQCAAEGFSRGSYNGALVDTKPAVSTPSPGSARTERPGVDVRASRVYLFSRRPLIGILRRAAQRRRPRRGRHPRPRARHLPRARPPHDPVRRHRLLVAALARGAARVAAVSRAGHRPRLPAGRSLRAARAPGRRRARRVVARPRRADRPLVRNRDRATTSRRRG